MNLFFRHIALPAIAPAAIVGLYLTPVQVFGCANRGLMALAVVLVSTVAGAVTAALYLRAKTQKRNASKPWLASTIILVLPAVLVLGPLG